jgi:hypothetical protein
MARQQILAAISVTREATGIYELRVLITGIQSTGFELDNPYKFRVIFRLYSFFYLKS